MNNDFKNRLATIADTAHISFSETRLVQERALIEEAGSLARQAGCILSDHPSIYHAGYV
tara:strand:+ start:69 stop:245 length:177 start_codon:yes stop_codon:yes gene_type:complete